MVTKFYQAKVALGYNNSAKSNICELLIEAKTEQMAYDTINSHFKQVKHSAIQEEWLCYLSLESTSKA